MSNDTQGEAPKKPQAVIKVVPLVINEEFTEPEGWLLKEIHSVDGEGSFFGVLVKIHKVPEVPKGKPVHLSKPTLPNKKKRK